VHIVQPFFRWNSRLDPTLKAFVPEVIACTLLHVNVRIVKVLVYSKTCIGLLMLYRLSTVDENSLCGQIARHYRGLLRHYVTKLSGVFKAKRMQGSSLFAGAAVSQTAVHRRQLKIPVKVPQLDIYSFIHSFRRFR